MKKFALSFALLLSFTIACFAQAVEPKAKIFLKAGTEISAQLENVIDSDSAKVSDDFSLTTTDDIDYAGGKILKGTVLTGRIVSIVKPSKTDPMSRVRFYFDFLKDGENYISLKAAVIGVKRAGNPMDFKFTPLANFDGATCVAQKAANLHLEKGDVFKIKLMDDLKSDN